MGIFMVGSCPSRGSCLGGELSLLGVFLVGNCPDTLVELSWRGVVLVGVVLVGSCPGGELS